MILLILLPPEDGVGTTAPALHKTATDVLPSDLHELYASEAVLRKLSALKIVELLSDRRDGSEVKMDRV